MLMSDMLRAFLRYCAVEEGLQKSTIRGMKQSINSFSKRSKINNLSEINESTLREFFYEGTETYQWSQSTYANYHKYLKKFFNWCISKGFMRENFTQNIKIPKKPNKLPRFLTKEQAEKVLLASFSHDWTYQFEQHRNYAIIATFLFTGIRASELLNLKVTDVNIISGTIFIEGGKNNKDRYVPIHYKLKRVLTTYIKERKRLKKNSEWFFTGLRSGKRLTPKNLALICKKISKQAGLKFTPHMLRHTFATEALNEGVDIFKTSKLLGHTDIKTTTIYLHTAINNLKTTLNESDFY